MLGKNERCDPVCRKVLCYEVRAKFGNGRSKFGVRDRYVCMSSIIAIGFAFPHCHTIVAQWPSTQNADAESVPARVILTLDVGIAVEANAAISAEKNIVGIDHLTTSACHVCGTVFSDEWSPDVV